LYIFDTNVFYALGVYYPSRFPTLWALLEKLAEDGQLQSVREVRREIEANCPYAHIELWVKSHKKIFKPPKEAEETLVLELFRQEQNRNLVKRQNILKGLPVADPFIIAAAKVKGGIVVTMEAHKAGGARIPTICNELDVECIDLESFLEREEVEY